MPQLKILSVSFYILTSVLVCLGQDLDLDFEFLMEPEPEPGPSIPLFVPLHYNIELSLASIMDPEGQLVDEEIPVKVKILGELNVGELDENPPMILLNNGPYEKSIISRNTVQIRVGSYSIPADRLDIEQWTESIRIQLGVKVANGTEFEVNFEYSLNTSKLFSPKRWISPEEDGKRAYFIIKYSTIRESLKLFPCVIDPNILSTFQLNVTRSINHTVVTNADKLSSEPDPVHPGWIRDRFQVTSPMKLSSFTFFLSNFNYLEKITSDGTIVRVHASQFALDEHENGDFVAGATANILDNFSNYFRSNISSNSSLSSLRKVDVVLDMNRDENEMMTADELQSQRFEPGLIILKIHGSYQNETERKKDSDSRWGVPSWVRKMQQQDIVLGLVSTILFQWFYPYDDLFQKKSWSDRSSHDGNLEFLSIYLMKEALGSISSKFLWNRTLETMITCTSDYRVDEYFGITAGGQCSDPMWNRVNFPVLRMLSDESVLGKIPIQNAIISVKERMERDYKSGWNLIKGKKYRELFAESIQETIQWREVGLLANISVKDVLDSWDNQVAGLVGGQTMIKQLIIVKVDVVNDTHLSFTQERIKGPLADIDWNIVPWHIPITVQTEDGLQARFWLSNSSVPVLVPIDHKNAKWVLLDPNSTSIHRTMYDPILLQKIQKQLLLDHTVFSPLARHRLFSDYYRFIEPSSLSIYTIANLALFENATILDALPFTQYLEKEDDILVWKKVLEIFAYTPAENSQNFNKPNFPLVVKVNEYMRPKYTSVWQTIDVENFQFHSSTQLNLWLPILNSACTDKNPICSEKAKELLHQWKANPSILSFNMEVSLMPMLFLNVIAGGEKEAFDFVVEHYLSGNNGSGSDLGEKLAPIALMLAYTNDAESFDQWLMNQTSIDTDNAQNGLRYYTSSALQLLPQVTSTTSAGVELYRSFFYKNCDRIEQAVLRLKATTANENIQVTDLFPLTFTAVQFEELQKFTESNPKCLGNALRHAVSMKLAEHKEKAMKHEEWLNSTGYEIYWWFGNNTKPYKPEGKGYQSIMKLSPSEIFAMLLEIW